jgi:hypothetical protein
MGKQPEATRSKPLTTGLGARVDRLVNMSPTLIGQIARARLRWPAQFKIEMGRASGHSGTKVTIQRGQSALEQVLSLAHELGHLLNDKGLIKGGATFAEFVDRNVNAKVQEEGAAVLTEIVVRRELRKAKQDVPLHVASLASGGLVNLEAWVGKPAFLQWINQVESELSTGDSVEEFWRDYFKLKRMEDVWRGTMPELQRKKPGSSSLFQLDQTLLASADPLFVPGSNRRPVRGTSRGQQAQAARAAQHAAASLQADHKRAEDARRQARQLRQPAEQRTQQARQERARHEELRKAAERADAEQRAKREAAAREQHAREGAARRRALEEAQRREAALAAARARRPPPVIDRTRFVPGPGGPLPKPDRVITIIHGPAQIGRPTVTGGPPLVRPHKPGKKPGPWR